MAYIIIEIQKSNTGTVAIVPPASYTDQQIAEQAYHTALAAAAVSDVNVHSVIMLKDDGTLVKKETYYHGDVPNPEE